MGISLLRCMFAVCWRHMAQRHCKTKIPTRWVADTHCKTIIPARGIVVCGVFSPRFHGKWVKYTIPPHNMRTIPNLWGTTPNITRQHQKQTNQHQDKLVRWPTNQQTTKFWELPGFNLTSSQHLVFVCWSPYLFCFVFCLFLFWFRLVFSGCVPQQFGMFRILCGGDFGFTVQFRHLLMNTGTTGW